MSAQPSLVVTGIGRLVTHDPQVGELADAAVVCEAGMIAWAGPESSLPEQAGAARIDVEGRCVVPGFVDSHTHLVFGGDRAEEFAARLAGRPYSAGGITTTVAATRAASGAALLGNARRLATEAIRSGTTVLEVKSGYGLTVDDERRCLEATAALAGDELPAVHPTFLGAHVVPPEHADDPDGYVRLVCGEMLGACAPLARWCDVFCERGAFDADQSRTVLAAGRSHGLGLRVHANQLGAGPGAQLAAEAGATAADHLTHLTDADIAALVGAGVVATLLPAVEFSTGSPYAPARRLLDAGATVALATDCNPGTSYTTSMPFVIALACREYGLDPAEALHAATMGGAAALGLTDSGHLGRGARADLVVLDAPSPTYLAYRPGVALIHSVVRSGSVVWTAP